jgi:hypothetical protein
VFFGVLRFSRRDRDASTDLFVVREPKFNH